jgi:hypothetical protein
MKRSLILLFIVATVSGCGDAPPAVIDYSHAYVHEVTSGRLLRSPVRFEKVFPVKNDSGEATTKAFIVADYELADGRSFRRLIPKEEWQDNPSRVCAGDEVTIDFRSPDIDDRATYGFKWADVFKGRSAPYHFVLDMRPIGSLKAAENPNQ